MVGHRNHIKQPAGGGSVGGDCVFGIIVSNNTYELEENSAQLLIDSVISFMRQRHNHKLTLNLTNLLKPIDKRIKRENK